MVASIVQNLVLFAETNALGRAWSTNLNLNFGDTQQPIIFLYQIHGLKEINKTSLEQIFFSVEIIHKNLKVKVMGNLLCR